MKAFYMPGVPNTKSLNDSNYSPMIPEAIQKELNSFMGASFIPSKIKSVGGGSINRAASFEWNGTRFFIKWNSADKYPRMFEKESHGLSLLRWHSEITVPEPLHADTAGTYAFLLMIFEEGGKQKPDFWENFGRRLAKMHQNNSEYFGLDRSNYIGSLVQNNNYRSSWSEFFIEMRLKPLLKMAFNSGYITHAVDASFRRFFQRMDELFPNEPPALLHGDLWSGNFMCGANGQAVLIDPAVYYGHREMDLAMSQLFGGFSPDFYSFYHEAYPLETGWESRMDLCNLYPLLVHINLFGYGYVGQLEQIIRKF